jgi:hypothetical protein
LILLPANPRTNQTSPASQLALSARTSFKKTGGVTIRNMGNLT